MEARRDPEYLTKLISDVENFRVLYQRWLDLHVITDSETALETPGLVAGMTPAVMRRENVTKESTQDAADDVARASGRIAHVASFTGAKIGVAGLGEIDPFVNALYVSRPKPVLEARDVLGACSYAIGRLEGLLDLAQAETAPSVDAAGLHPLVWGAASALWRDGHLRRAVTAGAEALMAAVKARVERNDVSDTAIWNESLSDDPPLPGKPRLRWPGDPTDLTVKSIRDGLKRFAPGAQMLIRNPSTHVDEEPTEQQALEQLSVISFLARHVDRCDLLEAEQPGGDPAES